MHGNHCESCGKEHKQAAKFSDQGQGLHGKGGGACVANVSLVTGKIFLEFSAKISSLD